MHESSDDTLEDPIRHDVDHHFSWLTDGDHGGAGEWDIRANLEFVRLIDVHDVRGVFSIAELHDASG